MGSFYGVFGISGQVKIFMGSHGVNEACREALGRLVRWLADKFFQTPSEGAQNVLAALQAAHEAQAKGESEEVALYWHCGQPQRPSEASLHPGLGAALWRASEAAVKEF